MCCNGSMACAAAQRTDDSLRGPLTSGSEYTSAPDVSLQACLGCARCMSDMRVPSVTIDVIISVMVYVRQILKYFIELALPATTLAASLVLTTVESLKSKGCINCDREATPRDP